MRRRKRAKHSAKLNVKAQKAGEPTNDEDMPGLIDVSDSEDDNDNDEDDNDDFAPCIPSKDKGKGKAEPEPEDAKAKVKVKAKDGSKMKGDDSKGKEKVKVSTKGGRKKGAKNFSREDTEGLLGLVKSRNAIGAIWLEQGDRHI